MAELTLQSYVAAIEAQLAGGAADEATYHSRHILSQYPRYTPAFRLLGRALLLKGQVAEAEAAFRRVLSVEPSDVTAHLGLSEIYDHRRRGEEAIWHAERAMETEITNVTITDLLRVLYRRYRGEEQPRMSLTAVALTRQALQNHDYTQAIATLRDALERQPERTDLRLLLAESLWESGDHVAAAETARDVAEVLPDCFTANAILTRLWLEVGRPSDAQPYLSRLEALDPYAAVALASGQAVEASAFTIEPLDYQRSAQSEVARGTPDWLKGIAPTEAAPDSPAMEWTSRMLVPRHEDEPAEAAPAEVETQLTPAADALAWLHDEPVSQETPALGVPAAGILSVPALSPSFDFGDAAAEAEDDDLFAGLESLFGETHDSADPFAAPFSTVQPPAEPPAPATDTSPLPPMDIIQARPMPPAEDAMAWLRESGVELVDDEAPAFSLETGEEFPEAAPHDQADPMAWLSSYDSVLAEPGTQEGEIAPSATMVFESGWEEEFISHAETPQAEMPGEEAPPEGAALFEPEPEPAAPALRGLTSRLGDPSITAALAAPIPEPAAEEPALEGWFAGFDEPAAAAQADSPAPEWLTDLGAVMTNEPNSAAGTPDDHEEILPHEPTEAAEAQPGWMSELGEAAPESELAASAEMPEWLLESVPDAFAAPETASAESAPAASDLMPDWLMESAPEAVTNLTGEAPAEAAPGAEEFDWLSTLNEPATAEPMAAVDEAVIAAQADVPDWLDALEADVLATIDANQSGEVQPEAAAEDVLPFEEPEAWPVAEAEAAEAEPEVEAFAASAEPEAEVILSGEVEPELTAEDWGEPEQADLARIAPPTVMSADFTPTPDAEVPAGDWYTDAQLAADVAVPADGSLTEPATGDWLEDAALHAAAEAEAWPEIVQDEADVEAWTAEPSFAAETQLGTDTVPWLAPLEPAAVTEEAPVEAAAEEAPAGAEGIGVVAGAAALGALAFAGLDGEDESETAAVEPEAVAEEAGWLAADWPDDTESAALIEADELDALPDIEIAEETRIAPAANAPDWLNAMVPGLDLDYEVAGEPLEELEDEGRDALDETLGAGSEYAWVIDLVDQEQAETETVPAEAALEAIGDAPRFTFQRLPAWFRHAASDEGEDDFADWPNDDSSLQAWQN